MNLTRKFLLPVIVVALVAAFAVTVFQSGHSKTLTAHFPRTVSLYSGSAVEVLGVPVGSVESVTPAGTDVVVTIEYDDDIKLPSDAKAVIVAPSIVGDRYVQITPVYKSGPVLKDGAVLQTDDTNTPLELDQIYSSLNDLDVALGPNGANSTGALTDLLNTTAANFGGEGAQFHTTIENFSKLSQTLDDNKDELFGSARELEGFINTLANNDSTVRNFNDSLSNVSDLLAGERQELAAALRNLSVGLGEVSQFVADNKQILGENIQDIDQVAKILVKRRGELNETLRDAPLALNNLALTYNPQAGTLDTNSNLTEVFNQLQNNPSTLICAALLQIDKTGTLCSVAQSTLPRTAPFGTGSAYGVAFDQSLGGLVPAETPPTSATPDSGGDTGTGDDTGDDTGAAAAAGSGGAGR